MIFHLYIGSFRGPSRNVELQAKKCTAGMMSQGVGMRVAVPGFLGWMSRTLRKSTNGSRAASSTELLSSSLCEEIAR